MTRTGEHVTLYIRIPKTLHDELRSFAETTYRSLTGAATVLIKEALEKREEGRP